MDNVLMKQFEKYLKSRGIQGSSETVSNVTSSDKKNKRLSASISHELTKNEVKFCDKFIIDPF